MKEGIVFEIGNKSARYATAINILYIFCRNPIHPKPFLFYSLILIPYFRYGRYNLHKIPEQKPLTIIGLWPYLGVKIWKTCLQSSRSCARLRHTRTPIFDDRP